MRSRLFVSALAVTIALGGLTISSASAAHAAKPEPLTVTVQATAGTTPGTFSYTFEVNSATRQLANVSVTGTAAGSTSALITPTLQSITNKTTRGTDSFSGLPTNTYIISVTATTRKGETATGSASVQVTGESRTVDLAGAQVWCNSVSGTWEVGGTYLLGWKDMAMTEPRYAENAEWACIDAQSTWTFPVDTAGNTEFSASIQSSYCFESPLNHAAHLTLFTGIAPVDGDTAVENFICYRITSP